MANDVIVTTDNNVFIIPGLLSCLFLLTIIVKACFGYFKRLLNLLHQHMTWWQFRQILSRYPESRENVYEGKGESINPVWKKDLEDIGIKIAWPVGDDGQEHLGYVRDDKRENAKRQSRKEGHFFSALSVHENEPNGAGYVTKQ